MQRLPFNLAPFVEGGLKLGVISKPAGKGFKAGALAYGMKICKGEFIAIFDADAKISHLPIV